MNGEKKQGCIYPRKNEMIQPYVVDFIIIMYIFIIAIDYRFGYCSRLPHEPGANASAY